MNKQLFVLLLLSSYTHAKDLNKTGHKKAELLVEKVYQHSDLTPEQKTSIEHLIAALTECTQEQQATIASVVASKLKGMAAQLSLKKRLEKNSNQQAWLAFQLMLTQIQQYHLERFNAHILNKEKNAKKKTGLWNKNLFGTKSSSVTAVSNQLLDYTQLEREHIFIDSRNCISFFHAYNNSDLPQIMRFWWFRPEQHKIIQDVKKLEITLTPCAAELVEAADIGGEVAAETTAEVAGEDGGEEIGVEAGADGAPVEEAVVQADAAQVAQLEKAAEPLTNQSQAITETTETSVATATKAVNESEPLENLGLISKSELAPEIEKSLTDLTTDLQKVTDATNNAVKNALESSSQKLTEQFNADFKLVGKNWAQARYSEGLVGGSERVMKNSADWIQNSLTKLSTKYPDSGALQALNDSFKASRTLFGAVYKYTPLGIIKWLQSSPTGKVLYDMLKLSLVMSGSSMYNSWINQQTFAAWAQLSTFKTQLGQSMQTVTTNIQTAFSVKNAQLVTQFQTQLQQMSVNQTALQSQNSAEFAYLTNALTQTTFGQTYLSVPMFNDKLFGLSTMLTPVKQAPTVSTIEILPVNNSPLTFSQQAQGSWTGPLVVAKKNVALSATGQTTLVAPLVTAQTTLENLLTALPAQAPVYPSWHNIFRRGNWEFLVTNQSNGYQGSFTQTQIVPLDATPTATTPIFLQALYNSIFTQYIPPAFYYKGTETHLIQIACTLNKVSYPFFMGVSFNQGRWISGVDQLRYQTRTVGVLGSAQNQSALWFGETFYLQPKNALNQQVNAIWPLWQFFRANSGDAAVWSQQNPNAVITTKPFYTDPVTPKGKALIVPNSTLIFSIITQPTQVTITVQLQAQNSSTPVTLVDNIVVQNLNPKTFAFHNISLIAAGCAASFTILHPQALTYDQPSLSAFLSEVSS